MLHLARPVAHHSSRSSRGLRWTRPPAVLLVARSQLTMAPKNKKAGQQPRSAHYSSHIRLMNVDNSTGAPSVLLFFDSARYLFNAGEGIQRHFIEHRQRLKRVTHVLATRVSTDTLGGVPGMLLSQVEPGAEVGKPGGAAVTASLHGPSGLRQYADAFRMYASSFSLDVNELDQGSSQQPIVSDGRVTITPLLLKAQPAAQEAEAANTAAAAASEAQDDTQEPAAKKPRHDTEPAAAANGASAAAAAGGSGSTGGPKGMASVNSSAGLQPDVVCYVCQLTSIPGKFDPQKAAQLGVPKGPLYGELQRGKSVTAVNGKTIHPSDVMSVPSLPGPCLVVVDCPSLDYLPALQSNPTLQALQQEAQQLHPPQQQQQQQGGNTDAPAAAGSDAQPQGEHTDAAAAAAAAAASGAQQQGGSAAEAAEARKRYVVVHVGPKQVSSSAEYEAWAAGFGPAADQMFISGDGQQNCTVRKAAQLQAQLNVIEPEVFQLGGFLSQGKQLQQQQQGLEQQATNKQQQQQQTGPDAAADGTSAAAAGAASSGGEAGAAVVAAVGPAAVAASDGVVFRLMPPRTSGLCLQAVTPPPEPEAVQAEVRSNHPQVMQLLQEYQAVKASVVQQQQHSPDPQVQGIDRRSAALTPLGTCSACPSNHRNVSSYYLDLFDRGGLLADCGEDSMGQLERRFGRAEAERRILELQVVWISHMHADHHGGLYPLLLRRQALQQAAAATAASADAAGGRDQAAPGQKPLLVLGPFPLFRVLCQYSRVLPLSFTFLPNSYFFSHSARPPPAEALQAYEAAKAAAGLAVLQPFPVQHVSNSSGLQVQSHSGWKVVFSGDTRPCQSVVDAARDATLLVHEATFEDDLQEEAIYKKHSTTAEALGVAAAANAYRTLLTHFSTRYPRIPVMKPPAEAAAAAAGSAGAADGGSDLAAVGSVMVAFDLMTLNLADLPWLPKMLPVLDELFKEEEEAYRNEDEAVVVEEGE